MNSLGIPFTVTQTLCSVFISVICLALTGFHVPPENQFSLLWEKWPGGKRCTFCMKEWKKIFFKCSAFKSQCFLSLWHIAHVFRHLQGRGIYWSLFMQIHFYWMKHTRETIRSFCQHIGFFAEDASPKPTGHASKSRGPSLLEAATLFLVPQ